MTDAPAEDNTELADYEDEAEVIVLHPFGVEGQLLKSSRHPTLSINSKSFETVT